LLVTGVELAVGIEKIEMEVVEAEAFGCELEGARPKAFHT